MGTKKKPKPEPRAGRRPIPKTERAWLAEVQGASKFVAKRVALKDANGLAWLNSMQTYYIERLAVLAKNVPPGMSKVLAKMVLAEVNKKLV